MQCPRCRDQYSTEGDLQPRIIIVCGHSYCKRCIGVLRKDDSGVITCPQCGQMSKEPDAPNVALMSYIALQTQQSNPDKIRDVAAPRQAIVCQHCSNKEVKFICYQCLPAGFKFCKDCCETEHSRSFGPLRHHKPIPIDQVKYGAVLPDCPRHPSRACEWFSFDENRFACEECMKDTSIKTDNFVDIETAVSDVRDAIPSLMTKVAAMRDRLQVTQNKLGDQLGKMDQVKLSAIEKVRIDFQDFEMALRKRLAYVESQVEETATSQKHLVNEQIERVEVALGSLTTSLIQANLLNQMYDYSLLQRATSVLDQMKKQVIEMQDDDLNEPMVPSEISIYVTPEFQTAVDNLGLVGGGPSPKSFKCLMDGGIIQLTWDKPDQHILEYEIICDLLFAEAESTSPVMRDHTFPRHFSAEGHDLSKRIDNLFPGMKYRFRIRSRNQSGWGLWSPSIHGTTPSFPLEINYSGKIVKIPLAHDGMYRVIASGAKAADGEKKLGGCGAIIEATFKLNKNDILEILVAGMSTRKGPCSGGGGGTFVGLNGRQELLIAAGGGGGTRGHEDEDQDGKDASVEPNGLGGSGEQWAAGGMGGKAGRDAISTGPCWGYGAAGYVENSTTSQSFVSGGKAGEGGGYGGGGAIGAYGGGGGGGYSGGGGGRGGGGGGSYVRSDGINVVKNVGNTGHGSVTIQIVKSPESC